MKNMSAKARLARAKAFFERAEALPRELLILDESDYNDTDSSRKSRSEKMATQTASMEEKNGLTLEVRSFVKLAYGDKNEYFEALHTFQFIDPNVPFVVGNTVTINKNWAEARRMLVMVLENIVAEEQEHLNIEDLMVDKTLPLRYGGFAAGFAICMLGIWAAPEDLLSNAFSPTTLFAVRFALSIGITLMLMTILAKEKWKEFLFTGIFGVAIALLPFLKITAPVEGHEQTSDTTATTRKDSILVIPSTDSKLNLQKP